MKKLLKLRFIIPLIFLIVLGVLFGGWHLSAKKPLDVVVVNKTIVMDKIDKDNNITADYRKHMGLYWILRQQRYTKEDGSFYNYRKDYYGPHPNEKGELIPRNLDRLESVPDLIYLSDAYGQAQDALEQKNGLTSEEMAVISSAHLHGATVVGEFNIAPSRPDHPVLSELQSLFGLTFSHWVGRYVPDMADLSDIPQWVLDLHEREYGSQWDYSGSGIIFASREGDLLILRRNIDYTGALFVEIKNAYQKQYGALKVNYYNWFELVTPAYDTKTIANYRMNLTDKGKKQLSKLSELISSAGEFPAILCSNGEGGSAPAYYFTGDFNDYVARERYGDFLFSNTFVRIFTYDRTGDITNFFRNFYQPFMERLLKEASGRSGKRIPFGQKNTEASARMGSEGLEVWNGQAFVPYTIKGFNINGVLPGDQPEEHTRDISVYSYFLESVAGMSGNTVRVYSLMPPEFYRALYQYNIRNPGAPLRFFQSIVPPKNITPGEYLSAAALEELEKSLKSTIDAIHGTGTVSSTLGGGTYILDVSPYLLGYIVEIDTEKSTIARLKQTGSGYTYSGEYISGGSGGPGEHLLARLCDLAFSYQASAYGTIVPVGAKGNPMLLPQSPWTEYHDGVTLNVASLEAGEKARGQFFTAYSLQPHDPMLLDHTDLYENYRDDAGSFPYGGYIRTLRALQARYPVLIDRMGLSTNVHAFDQSQSVNGLSEQEQGSGLTRMLTAARKEGFFGALISDLDDNWAASTPEQEFYTIPQKNNTLWHNLLDPAENTGIIAVKPAEETDIGMSLKDTEFMREMQLTTDAEYLYMTILLSREPDFRNEQLIIGLDTYHRNFGEYLYDPEFFTTSLSGMEYIIKFTNKEQASIYVVPDYNREQGKYCPKESYTGRFDLVTRLQYGTFEYSNNNFYQTGSTIHIRIPWGLLNFTDPSRRLVISDTRTPQAIAADAYGLQTQNTSGILFSLMLADLQTRDTLYAFPLDKQASGYKTFSWNTWDTPKYQMRLKESFNILLRYFDALK